ncbi:hypothetical protein [Chelativorans sp. Marseille-P2723]|uniref:hypothetical protein n=1 Tax=Chelativorans sp. Marseille-P2723 TaxID=2709133 RepID=UPI00156EC48E|nr:hypothetical protein [Chelativorans sp. Marseille-P2723]
MKAVVFQWPSETQPGSARHVALLRRRAVFVDGPAFVDVYEPISWIEEELAVKPGPTALQDARALLSGAWADLLICSAAVTKQG